MVFRRSQMVLMLPLTIVLLYLADFIDWRGYDILRRDDAPKRSDALRQHIKDACKQLSLPNNLNGVTLAHMHYDDSRKVIYCFIPKVACTSWKRVWFMMTGLLKPEDEVNFVSRYLVHSKLPLLANAKDKKEKLRTYKKFMLVRHPAHRVLSAYRDKLESLDKDSSYDFHKIIGKKIEMKYRGTTAGKGKNVTFPEFIRFISEPGGGTAEQRNEHWLPMHTLCSPCSVDYDFIGKFEHLKEDSDYLLKWLGLTELISEFPVADRPFQASSHFSKYYGQLSKNETMAFLSKYKTDFLLFNYTQM
ncbi:carbohydrate sulfotransferase 11-like isoform X2 [Portunus trituberculatus]|uniref:carbohydrate sulfotransferase 11-like isoform X2 n=1 Tax=Portunus trituberculatus TaxID=210409 RepID=UPI001E1CBE8D|nr:carbohydrate sulfotransferase 11-like isoform X2 [Portunus trituberculatus]XP_045127630.1 carbohydrate sulfotransferase 11-like isoform X2 [Portunus trituberculatus]